MIYKSFLVALAGLTMEADAWPSTWKGHALCRKWYHSSGFYSWKAGGAKQKSSRAALLAYQAAPTTGTGVDPRWFTEIDNLMPSSAYRLDVVDLYGSNTAYIRRYGCVNANLPTA